MRTEDQTGEISETLIDESQPSLPRSSSPGAGQHLDRYIILNPLGEGGGGRVYSAYDPELDRRIALKILRRRSGPDAEDRQAALAKREAQALARVAHPNVVTIHDVGVHDGSLYLAMEQVEGLTLREWVREQSPPWRAVLARMVEAGGGLAAIHHAGLVHRDFKPDNVMVGRDGRTRVMDLGLARSGAEPTGERGHEPETDDTTLTRTGTFAGTPAYMAPEQHLGGPFDARTDQFALCVTAWEMLYGIRPFAGENLTTIAFHVTQGEITPPPAGTDVPGWVRRALERGLSVSPEARFPSLAELLEALSADPSQRRRRLGAATALVVTVAGVVAWASMRDPAPEDPCANVSAPTQVWNDERQTEVVAAFERTGSPLAASAAAKVGKHLDRWAKIWTQSRREACEATHVRRERSVELMDRQMACLDGQRARVGRLVELFEGADEDLVREAASISANVGAFEDCLDLERLDVRHPVPSDPAVATRVRELTLQLEEMRALADAKRFTPLLDSARALAADARPTGFAPLIVDVELLVAAAEEVAVNPAKSAETTEAAYYQALAAGLEEPAARAAVRMMWRTSLVDPKSPALPLWSRHAEALVARADPEGPLEASRLVNAGIHAWTGGDLERAADLTLRGVRIAEQSLGPRSARVADYRNNLAYLSFTLGDRDTAKREFGFCLEVWSETLGDDHPRLGVAKLSLGQIAAEEDRWDDVERLAGEALSLAEGAGEGAGLNAAYALVELGRAAARRGDEGEARRHYARSAELARGKMGERHWRTALPALRLAELEVHSGRAAQAAQSLPAVLEVLEPIGLMRLEHADGVFALAQAQRSLGDDAQALELGRRAEQLYAEVGPRGKTGQERVAVWLRAAEP